MGLFPINGSTIGKALPLTAVGGAGVANISDTLDSRSAWLFENQTGTLGTNLNSSVLYVGVTGDINCILSGVVGVQGTVTALDATDPYGSNPSYNALSNGSGYFTANGLLTSATSSVPKSPAKQPSGLTVDITVAVPTSALVVGQGGTTYTAGNAFTSTVAPAGGTGIIGTIATTSGGGATGPAATLTITRGGSGYSVNDVITIVSAGSDNLAKFTITGALNGAITTIAVNAAGSNYSPGDIITVTQAGASGGTRAILRVVDSAPTIGDAVIFKNVPMGTILPVSVDYLMATGSTANLVCIAGK
jgi:hypothetical protein